MRTRLLRDGWFKDEDLAEVSAEARILFMGLHCYADKQGKFDWKPKRIRAEIFPYDTRQDTARLLRELEDRKLIVSYEAAGHAFGFIPSFLSCQSPHKKEAESVIPDFPGLSTDVHGISGKGWTAIEIEIEKEIGTEIEIEKEIAEIAAPRKLGRQVTTENRTELAPRIVVKDSERVALIAEFGEEQVIRAAERASDWLLAEGKTKKNYAAFMRNWLRRESESGRSRPQFENSRERNEKREALAIHRLKQVEESGARSLFHVGLEEPKVLIGRAKK